MAQARIRLVDTTLRDGSHAVSHSFTVEDVVHVAAGLDAAGVEVIEISHGDGLGGSSVQYGFAASTDLDRLRAAALHVRKAKIAVLLLPGIGTKEDLAAAAECGAKVARVATHVTEADISQQHIGFAKEAGMEVMCFLMMAHMVDSAKVLEQALLMESYGADVVYVVDSAGAMLPSEVREKVSLLCSELRCAVGFHAHNNLGLAIGNSLAAIESGASIVDGTLRGIGAGAGNAPLELLVAALNKAGVETGVELFPLLDLAEECASRLPSKTAIDPSAIMLGYAGVYSTFLLYAHRAAEKFHVDPRSVLIELGRQRVVGGQEDMILDVAREMASRKSEGHLRINLNVLSTPDCQGGTMKKEKENVGDKLNVGVIGLGFFGSMHAKVWASPLPNARLAALCDTRENILQQMGTQLGVKSCYTDYREILANPEIDAVDVVVDEDKHYEVVMEALGANKHVMVEKPIAIELKHAEEMARKSSACKRIMMVGHILRFDLRHYFLKKQIQDGVLGDVVSIHARRNTARVSSGKDALGMAVRVHPILTTSIHDVDLMHWLTNDTVRKVHAEHRAVVDGKHYDSAWAMFTFAKGAVGIVETVLHLPGKSPGLLDYSITVIGTKGAAKLSSGRGFEIWGEEGVIYPDTDFVQPFVDGHLVGPLREELAYFADHAQAQREPTRITVRDAVNATRVCLAVVQSAKDGKIVELNY